MQALPPFNLRPVHLLLFLPWLALLGWMADAAWFLTDDAFISFRYVRNLLEGHGLVFNRGERVEGYSNFLWVLELAALWGAFGLRPEHAAPWLSVAFTAATLAAMLWWVARRPSLAHRGLVGWMALGLVSGSATFATWTSGGGLETRQLTFFVVLAVVWLSLYRDRRRALLVVSWSLAAASLTRPEGPLFAACCFAWYVLQRRADTGRWAPQWRAAACLVGPCVLVVASHYLWRYGYYGEWLPNTYYAKHVRPWYEMGARYLWAAALETGLYLLLPLAVVSLVQGWRGRRCLAPALPLLCIVLHMAYVARIGGDYFEYRPLDFYWPLLAVPAAEGVVHVGLWVSGALRRLRPFASLRPEAMARTCAVVLFLPVLFYSSARQGALLLEDARIASRSQTHWLLAAPGMPMLTAISDHLRLQLVRHYIGVRSESHRRFAAERISRWQAYEDMERDAVPHDAVMASGRIGIPPYYVPDLTVVDEKGLTDATVARTPVTHSNDHREMAHDRRPQPGYLTKRGVNFTVYPALSGESPGTFETLYAAKVGHALWMPFDSSEDVKWVTEAFAGRDLRSNLDNILRHFNRAEPVLRSDFDVYLADNRLLYTGEECSDEDLAHPFFVHVVPVDEGDLPEWNRWHGFQYLDFEYQIRRLPLDIHFVDLPVLDDVECAALVELPDYDVARIRTGQYVPGSHQFWEGEIRFDIDAQWISGVIESTQPVIRSDFNVYHADNRLLYTGEGCSDEDLAPPFFLNVFPEDESDLPADQREHELHYLDFRFEARRLPLDFHFKEVPAPGGVKCVAVVDLPGYPIAAIRTGQYVPESHHLWAGEMRFDIDARWISGVIESTQPVIRSDFNVYHADNRLLYTGEGCSDEDLAPPFFVHVVPVDEGDLPAHSREHGLHYLDFQFQLRLLPLDFHFEGLPVPGDVECAAVVDLPEYPIAAIRTGQYVPDSHHLWEGELQIGNKAR